MSMNGFESPRRAHLHTAILAILFLGLALALVGNVYQFTKADQMSRELKGVQHSLQTQITRLSDATSGAFDVTQERFLETKKLQDSTAAALTDARAELKRTNAGMIDELEGRNEKLARENRDLAAQLATLKQETSSKIQKTSSALLATNSKVDAASARLDRIAAAIENNQADLKRVAGDLATMRAPVASAAPKRPPVLRDADERDRVPFDLLTTRVPTKIGEIQIAIVSTDPKKNGYTLDLYTDRKLVGDAMHSVNEPVQFYVSGHEQPYELVVTEVKRDEVRGYVSEPASSSDKLESSATTLHHVGTRP